MRLARKDPEAFKAVKKYVAIEEEYKKLEKYKNTLGLGTTKRRLLVIKLREYRYRQAKLYRIIAKNCLLDKLSEELGIGKTMPYRRYVNAMRRKNNGKR